MKKTLILLSIIYSFSFGNSLLLGEYESGSQEVYYSSESDIGGFQFNVVDGATVSGASGGVASEQGFVVAVSGSSVLGFTFAGGVIPAGSGVLTVLNFVEGTLTGATGLDNIVVTDINGNALSIDYGSSFCYYDCAGVCEGDAVYDECGACDNDSSNDCVEDCNGTWGGDAVIDGCGVCGGDADGSDCNNDGIDDVCEEDYQAGFDTGYDEGFYDGEETGDVNHSGELNVTDIVIIIENILNGD